MIPLVSEDSRVTGYAWEWDKTQHVLYQGTDFHIHELWLRLGRGWQHNDLTAAGGAPNFCVWPFGYTWSVDQTQHVVFFGYRLDDLGDFGVHELRFKHGDGWQHNNLSQKTGQQFGVSNLGTPIGYTWDADRTQHVVCVSVQDMHVHEFWDDGSGWRHNDLTAEANAPAAFSDLTAYTWQADQSEHVIYCKDQHVHELWLSYPGRWQHNDLTAATGAPTTLGRPAAYSWNVDRTEHVIYYGTDSHLHELWLALGDRWRHRDLTIDVGAPTNRGGLWINVHGYTWDIDQAQHVVYRTDDGHVHELWFTQGNDWQHHDLTVISGAPPFPVQLIPGTTSFGFLGGTDPFGYAWNGDLSQHVVYAFSDGHIHELWDKPGTGWHYHDLTALFA